MLQFSAIPSENQTIYDLENLEFNIDDRMLRS